MKKLITLLLALCLVFGMTATAFASSFTDAHGNVVELDDTLEAYNNAGVALLGNNNAARKYETNLGDLWTDALAWFAKSGKINEYFEADDLTAGNDKIAVDADKIVALWNGGNLRADIAEGKFGAAELAKVLPYPNKVAVVYMTGAQLTEALEAASAGLPLTNATVDSLAAFMQVSGLKYTVDVSKKYDAGEAYGKNWFKANSLSRVTITEVNGKAFDADACYAVITSNANYNGMDSSYIFKEAVAANEKSTITTAVVRDIVWMYIDEELNNVVGSEYAAPQGRIDITGITFEDVAADAFYADAVNWAVLNNVMGGTSETTFSPLQVGSRALAVTALWNALGAPAPTATETKFTDVDPAADYYNAILWAYENGIINGNTETTFNPDGKMIRSDIATLLYRAIGAPEVTGKNIFTDVVAGSYYENAVIWATENGIVNGIGNNLFAPAVDFVRADIATLLYRYCK